jgi:hypothetical protein
LTGKSITVYIQPAEKKFRRLSFNIMPAAASPSFFVTFALLSKCSNLIYTICKLVFKLIPVRSKGKYRDIQLSDKPEAIKKKPQSA